MIPKDAKLISRLGNIDLRLSSQLIVGIVVVFLGTAAAFPYLMQREASLSILLLLLLSAFVAALVTGYWMRGYCSEVWDTGDSLILRRKDGREVNVPITDIAEVRYGFLSDFNTVLLLKRDAGFGRKIIFIAKWDVWAGGGTPHGVPNAATEMLRYRVEKAQGKTLQQ